jgi:hypothetical protein
MVIHHRFPFLSLSAFSISTPPVAVPTVKSDKLEEWFWNIVLACGINM